MSLMSISEVAARSGMPVSTVRYYERIELVRPQGRAGNNYRQYDPSAVDCLVFIANAKALGLSLAEIRGLLDAWATGDCGPLASRLQACLSNRVAQLRRRIEGDRRTERRVRALLRSVGRGVPAGKCRPDCGCELGQVEDRGQPPIACTLDDGDLHLRRAEWRRLLASARTVERTTDWLRAEYEDAAAIVAEVSRLCAAEVACCSFLEFDLEIGHGALVLTIRGLLPAENAQAAQAS
ncbi:MAG: MerR family transcriptional regulator [Acidimicrobiales bacterium]